MKRHFQFLVYPHVRYNMKQIFHLFLIPPFINHAFYSFIILAYQRKISLWPEVLLGKQIK